MSEAPRNSVEIPLSKTLVALKRVRSLRDPTTNSISKFAILEHINCEANSCKGANVEISSNDKHHLTQSKDHHLKEENEGIGSNSESNYSSRVPNCRSTSGRKPSIVKVRGLDPSRTKLVHRVRRDCPSRSLKSLDSARVKNSVKHEEDEVDSYKEPTLQLTGRADVTERKKSYYAQLRKSSTAVSRVGSPCFSVGEAHSNGSRRSNLALATTEGTQVKSNDIVDSNFSGCGISYCWSGTPKYRGRNLYSDDEEQEQPLLSAEGTETAHKDAALYVESPRSLSQKFRPRSFNELVGLNVVTQSLLYAIRKRKVAPLYLFHGPRGSGKTTTARIFAAALNCLSLEEHRPCGFCRECVFLFSGKSKDVKELDAAKINHKARIKALQKSASLVPLSSHFKIFIIDECQSLQEEAWVAIFKSIDELSQHAVYVMITSDLDALPRSAVSQCQKYHFPKVKDVDIACKLQKMCIQEELEFDMDALNFVASKSNGSLRDAETMLDQLALLGKRITLSLVYELIGAVSDDELLDLLDLALSSDTANTVRRARELMSSIIDPLQLISQLANVIMDILAGKSGLSEVGKSFIRRHASEVGMQKLRHALKVLSDTEKQLRTSKNQATWLTVALLQFSNEEYSPLVETNSSHACPRLSYLVDDSTLSTTSAREDHRSSFHSACNHNRSNCLEKCCNRKKLENIWKQALSKCPSNSLKTFLLQEGNLSSICILEGVAVAELEFYCPGHVSRALKSQEQIVSALQSVLGCNTDIRIKLASQSTRKDSRAKKSSFNFLNCSGRNHESSDSMTDEYDEPETSARRETSFKIYSSYHQQLLSPFTQQFNNKPLQEFYDVNAAVIKKTAENAQSTESVTTDRPVLDELPKECKLESDYTEKAVEEDQVISIHEPEVQPSCFAKTLKLQRKLFSSDTAHTICLRIQPQNKLDFSIPNKTASESYISLYDSYTLSSRSASQLTFSSKEETIPSKDSRLRSNLLCWRSPKSQVLH